MLPQVPAAAAAAAAVILEAFAAESLLALVVDPACAKAMTVAGTSSALANSARTT